MSREPFVLFWQLSDSTVNRATADGSRQEETRGEGDRRRIQPSRQARANKGGLEKGSKEGQVDDAYYVPGSTIQAKRARQLQNGARPFLPTTSKKPTVTSMEEVRRGLVKYTDSLRVVPEDLVPQE